MNAIRWLFQQIVGAAIVGAGLFLFLLFCGWMESHPVVSIVILLPVVVYMTIREFGFH